MPAASSMEFFPLGVKKQLLDISLYSRHDANVCSNQQIMRFSIGVPHKTQENLYE